MQMPLHSAPIPRRHALVGVCGALAALAARAQPAAAPAWPSGPITIHTPYLSGGRCTTWAA